MSPAMEHAPRPAAGPSRARRAWIWAGLLACAPAAGCARMSSFRLSDQPLPMLGLLSREPATAEPDLYAQALTRGRDGSRTALARATPAAGRPPRTAPMLAERPAEPPSGGFDPAGPELTPPSELTAPPAAAPEARSEVEPIAAPAPGPTDSARGPAGPAPSDGEARALIAKGRDRLRRLSSYQVRLVRQERVGAALQPEEEVLLSLRREPRAVRIEWPAGPHKGREVLYSATDPGVMHVNMADSAIPLPPLRLALDSPRVVSSSRHPITEAGLDAILEKLEGSLDQAQKGGPGADAMSTAGPAVPEGLDRPCLKVRRVAPDGETWVVDLDAETGLPALVQANAANGDLLERYHFRDLKADPPELANAAAFDPEGRWGKPGGLLGRLTRTAAGSPAANAATR
jgi:hypothetical protein